MQRRIRIRTVIRGAALALAVVAFGIASPGDAHAEALADVFRAANQAYFRGDYKAAVQNYQRIVDAGVRDADVYFNLGVASAREDELGSAILNLERAARLRPGDAETNAALETARATLGKRLAQAKGEATIQAKPPISEALVRSVAEDTLAVSLLVFDVLFFGLLLAYPRLKSDAQRNTTAVTAAACGVLLAISGTGLFLKRGGQSEGHAGVVLREGAELREGPDRHARQRAAAHEGVSARVLASDGSYVRVKIPGGAEGWMAERDVGLIAN
jgi:tetratricopeptide (TPR) repeat protein